jgi:primosomal protein N' (replication factor Y)
VRVFFLGAAVATIGKINPQTAYLNGLGWHVLRFWNNDILQNADGVLEVILRACEERCEGKPSPCPLPYAGEGK